MNAPLWPRALPRVNDWLLKINDVDLANKDRKQVIKAVLGVEGVINMVVRRRRSLGTRVVTPVQLSLVGHKGPVTPFYLCFTFYIRLFRLIFFGISVEETNKMSMLHPISIVCLD